MFPSPSRTPDKKPCQAGTAHYELARAQQFPHPVLLETQGTQGLNSVSGSNCGSLNLRRVRHPDLLRPLLVKEIMHFHTA